MDDEAIVSHGVNDGGALKLDASVAITHPVEFRVA